MTNFLVQENVRNKIKLLLKFSKKNDLIQISSVSSIVSQYSIEDANLLDSFISDFFYDYDFDNLNLNEFVLPINIVIFRDETETELNFFSFSKIQMIKLVLDGKVKINSRFSYFYFASLLKRKFFFLNKYSYFLNFLRSVKGTEKTFKNREFLKSRKINFRRKVKKDTYDEF